jgi:phenylacetic acid degradation operon negative regulatory protein
MTMASSVTNAPVDAADEVDLPRVQEGSSPQHLLVTLLGDYWMAQSRHLPSAAVVRMLEEFGVTTLGARAALSRLSRRGLLETSRIGRRTFYGLTPSTARRLAVGAQRIISFGDETDWDGSWLVVAYSVPEEQRETRHLLRSRLNWLGFAPLYDGVWVSPKGIAAEVAAVIDELGLRNATVLRAVEHVNGTLGRRPIEAWDLDGVRAAYEDFIKHAKRLVDVIRKGNVTPAMALRERTRIMDSYRRFPSLDPEFPLNMMPEGWPRLRARELFREPYDALGPLALIRVRQLIAETDPDLAELATYRSSRELATIPPSQRTG